MKNNYIGIIADESPELFSGLPGILKAGSAFVPINPVFFSNISESGEKMPSLDLFHLGGERLTGKTVHRVLPQPGQTAMDTGIEYIAPKTHTPRFP